MTVAQLMKKYTVIYRTRRSNPMFARTRHYTLSCIIGIQYISSDHNNLSSVSILSSHLRLISGSVSSIEVFGQKFQMNLLSLTCVLHAKTDHFNNIWWRAEIVKILILQLYSASCYFLPLRSRCPKHPVLGHFQSSFIYSMKVSRP